MAMNKPCMEDGSCDNLIVIVDEIQAIVTAVDSVIFPSLMVGSKLYNKHINFQPGSSFQIIQQLIETGGNPAAKGTKYPLIALFQPFPEDMGKGSYKVSVTIPKIVIACLTNNTDDVFKRYGQTFKPILYPIYDEFLNQLALYPKIVGNDKDLFKHTKLDVPGSPPPADTAKQKFNDYLDAIHILNLQLTFQQNC